MILFFLPVKKKKKLKAAVEKKKKKKTQYFIKNNQTKLVETKQTIRRGFFFQVALQIGIVGFCSDWKLQITDP